MVTVATSILPPSISIAGGSRLKEVVFDRSVARVDAVCHTLASRFSVTRERLSRLGSAVTSSTSLKDLTLHSERAEAVREFIFESVCAKGLDFLERTEAWWGLRERTEAILEFILPPLDTSTKTDHSDSDGGQAYVANGAFCHLPRALTTHLLQTFEVQLSRSAKLQVTIVCLKDACAATYQRLCRSDLWPLLARMHLGQLHEMLVGTTKDSAAVAARFVHVLGERVLGGRLAIEVFGRLATVLYDAFTLGTSDETSSGIAAPESSQVEDPHIQDWEVSGTARATTQQFHLVVKNSFLEFLEEEPEVMRRSQSDILDRPAERIGLSEPFTLAVTCFDYVNVGGPVSNRPHCTGDIASRAEGSSHQGAQPSPDEAAPSAQSNVGSGDVADVGGSCSEESRTTIMLRNLPPGCTRSTLLANLDRHGFAGKYEFVYLPMDFSRGVGLGYALVSMASVAEAQRLRDTAPHISDWGLPGDCFCEASWSEPRQDLAEHVERYRNSPVMHPSVPDEYKPVLFEGGVRVEFPAPTKAVRPPRIRHLKPGT